ncbi:MAG: hypothetical protein EB060_08085 [Proteobacteria bacterium]|nr:hypothetical protein [Pseudomonadota bacterium]
MVLVMNRRFVLLIALFCIAFSVYIGSAVASQYYFFCPPNNIRTACSGCDCTCGQMVRPCKAGQTWVKTVFGYICTGNPIAECMTSEVDSPPGSNTPGEYPKRGEKRDAWNGGPWTGFKATPDYIPGPYNNESIPQYVGGQGQCETKNKDGGIVKYKKCKPPTCEKTKTTTNADGSTSTSCEKYKCADDEPECHLTNDAPPQCKPYCYECDTVCSGICANAKFNCQQVDKDLYIACLSHAFREFNRCVYYWPQKHCETYMPDEQECCIRNRGLTATCNLP